MLQTRRALRRVRDGWRLVRFRLWSTRLRFELARRGARLVLDAPHGAFFETLPILRVILVEQRGGTLTLRIGRDVRFDRDVSLEVWAHGDSLLEIGDHARILDGVHLYLHAGEIRLGVRSSVRLNASLKSSGRLEVGDDVFVGPGSVVHCEQEVRLSRLSGLAEGVTVVDSDHVLDGSDVHFYNRPRLVTPVVLGTNVFVASRAVVTRGSRIGANAAVGAGAVLTGGDYPGGWLIAGVPARPVSRLGKTDPGPAG